jgi:hypothetical protein
MATSKGLHVVALVTEQGEGIITEVFDQHYVSMQTSKLTTVKMSASS